MNAALGSEDADLVVGLPLNTLTVWGEDKPVHGTCERNQRKRRWLEVRDGWVQEENLRAAGKAE